jgi:hypothetical protein
VTESTRKQILVKKKEADPFCTASVGGAAKRLNEFSEVGIREMNVSELSI